MRCLRPGALDVFLAGVNSAVHDLGARLLVAVKGSFWRSIVNVLRVVARVRLVRQISTLEELLPDLIAAYVASSASSRTLVVS